MFSRIKTSKSTEDFSGNIKKLKTELKYADAVVIGAGAGLSAAAGFDYGGERFRKYFSGFEKKYGFHDMYSGGFYPYGTPEEYWAYWSRHILINRYDCPVGKVYEDLLSLIKNKDYFVLTTNVDHQFQRAGFDKKRLFYTQGDYGLFQCIKPCCRETFDNEALIREMAKRQRDMKIPAELIPKCPVCGRPAAVNLRCDDKFVQDEGWYSAAERYGNFIRRHEGLRVLFLELGVGFNTPAIIKYPFWQMTAKNPKAVYACINYGEALCPDEIGQRSVCISTDIAGALPLLSD